MDCVQYKSYKFAAGVIKNLKFLLTACRRYGNLYMSAREPTEQHNEREETNNEEK